LPAQVVARLSTPLRLVLDTNIWLDWLVFDDAGIAPLKAAAAAARTEIFIDDACARELAAVLGYPLRKEILDAAAPSRVHGGVQARRAQRRRLPLIIATRCRCAATPTIRNFSNSHAHAARIFWLPRTASCWCSPAAKSGAHRLAS
jgi:hypothetical protein